MNSKWATVIGIIIAALVMSTISTCLRQQQGHNMTKAIRQLDQQGN